MDPMDYKGLYNQRRWTATPWVLQGSGTAAVEAMLGSTVPRDGKAPPLPLVESTSIKLTASWSPENWRRTVPLKRL